MGTRITGFVVDCAGFSDWLGGSVADVLFYIARHVEGELAGGDPTLFHAFDTAFRHRYVISPSREILRSGYGRTTTLTPISIETIREIPVVACPLGEYLREQHSLSFKFLFDSLSACPGIGWVRRLTAGCRAWWIFSLLQAAREIRLLPPELHELERLCARMLRGYQFREPAYPLKPHKSPPPPGSLPVLPKDDTDDGMAVFTPTDCVRWFELIEPVVDRVSIFKAPGPWMKVTDKELDELVRLMLRSFGLIREIPLADPRLVTFIG